MGAFLWEIPSDCDRSGRFFRMKEAGKDPCKSRRAKTGFAAAIDPILTTLRNREE
jgi:hypothetical protein